MIFKGGMKMEDKIRKVVALRKEHESLGESHKLIVLGIQMSLEILCDHPIITTDRAEFYYCGLCERLMTEIYLKEIGRLK